LHRKKKEGRIYCASNDYRADGDATREYEKIQNCTTGGLMEEAHDCGTREAVREAYYMNEPCTILMKNGFDALIEVELEARDEYGDMADETHRLKIVVPIKQIHDKPITRDDIFREKDTILGEAGRKASEIIREAEKRARDLDWELSEKRKEVSKIFKALENMKNSMEVIQSLERLAQGSKEGWLLYKKYSYGDYYLREIKKLKEFEVIACMGVIDGKNSVRVRAKDEADSQRSDSYPGLLFETKEKAFEYMTAKLDEKNASEYCDLFLEHQQKHPIIDAYLKKKGDEKKERLLRELKELEEKRSKVEKQLKQKEE
jgi:hypothetical protein